MNDLHQIARARLLAMLLFLPPMLAAQQSLLVPSQFPSVAAAVAAAAPGDTIVLDSNSTCPATDVGYGDLLIDRHLSIIGRPGVAAIHLYSYGTYGTPAIGGGGAIRLGPQPVDLTLDNLLIQFEPNQLGALSNGIGLTGAGRHVRILSCTIRVAAPCPTWTVNSAVSLSAASLYIRSSVIRGYSAPPEQPCYDTNCAGSGSSALEFTGQSLIIEESTLEAGDSGIRLFTPIGFGCNPPAAIYSGKPAVTSNASRAILRDVTLRNGHASWLEPGPWLPPTLTMVQATLASSSTLGQEVHPWDVTELHGWNAHIASPRPSTPAATTFLGTYGSLRLHGEARVGTNFTITVSNNLWSGIGVVALGTGLLPPPTVPGGLLLDISNLLLIDLVGITPPGAGPVYNHTLPIPLDPTLIGSMLPAQVARFDGWFGNVSCVVLRAP